MHLTHLLFCVTSPGMHWRKYIGISKFDPEFIFEVRIDAILLSSMADEENSNLL